VAFISKYPFEEDADNLEAIKSLPWRRRDGAKE